MDLEGKLNLLLSIPDIRYFVRKFACETQDKQAKIGLLSMLLEADPKDKLIANNLADAHFRAGNYDDALKVSAQYLNQEEAQLIKNKIFYARAEKLWFDKEYCAAFKNIKEIPDSENRECAVERLISAGLGKGVTLPLNELAKYMEESGLFQTTLFYNVAKKVLEKNLAGSLDSIAKLSNFINDLSPIKNYYSDMYESMLSKAASKRANILAKNGNGNEAIKSLDVLKFKPSLYEEGMQNLLKVIDKQHHLQIYDLLIEQNPCNPQYWESKADLLTGGNKIDEAIGVYDTLINLGNKTAYLRKATLLEQKGDWQGALKIYEKIVGEKMYSDPNWMKHAGGRLADLQKKLNPPEEKKEEKKEQKKGFFGRKKR